ncbi:hypothetical protein [Pauljensenia sp. 20925_1_25]
MVVASGRTLATIQWYRMPKDGTEATMIEGPRCLVLAGNDAGR